MTLAHLVLQASATTKRVVSRMAKVRVYGSARPQRIHGVLSSLGAHGRAQGQDRMRTRRSSLAVYPGAYIYPSILLHRITETFPPQPSVLCNILRCPSPRSLCLGERLKFSGTLVPHVPSQTKLGVRLVSGRILSKMVRANARWTRVVKDLKLKAVVCRARARGRG